jgi:hypothetical protein
MLEVKPRSRTTPGPIHIISSSSLCALLSFVCFSLAREGWVEARACRDTSRDALRDAPCDSARWADLTRQELGRHRGGDACLITTCLRKPDMRHMRKHRS